MNWRQILDDAVAGSSVTAVAARLGVSRTSVSLLMSGKYPGGTERMEARIVEVYGPMRACPVYGGKVNDGICAERKAAPMPTSSPYALRRWRECKTCKGESDVK